MDTSIQTDLDHDLAALKARAADYEAQHKVLARVDWPAGVRVAVNFTADFDTMLLRRLLNEPPSQLAKGEFGGRVAVDDVGRGAVLGAVHSHVERGVLGVREAARHPQIGKRVVPAPNTGGPR